MNNRFDELDSLRGLAASSVLISHLFLAIPGAYFLEKFKNTPVHSLWGGHEAVILFFVLSGFVLSLSYYKDKAPKYKDYLIKRICRIYFPYLASILLSIILMSMFSRMPLVGLDKAINNTWLNTFTMESLINHVIFVGDFQSQMYNPVVWSLIHEMRISIVFPLLMYFLVKLNWKKSIVIAPVCTVLYFVIWYFVFKVFHANPTYLITLHYVGFFILGSLIARHREYLKNLYTNFSNIIKIIVLLAAILCYTYTWWFLPNVVYAHLTIINDWFIALGGSVFIVYSNNTAMIKRLLLFKPIHFIGKTSYSLYLFHLPVFLTLINIFYGKIPTWLILIISFIASYVFAGIMYYLVEKPSILLGRRLTTNKNKLTLNSGQFNEIKVKLYR
ncbi:acyltransferase family protein [Paenibacillus sp. 5J-6]|uniref:Acyltransferase family protein n=1 Tax=Paenibacillus silvestris TaxID=2606219 RepID=A0A6L8V272_9BACL|nr:acyltransferase family protein [Paenibacillus silvestris]